MIELDRDRFVDLLNEQSAIGETADGGLHRLALSADDRAARDWFREHLEDAGLEVRVDEFGNTFGRRAGTDPDASPVLLGSHLDSQPNGGIYDGALGVVAALEFVLTLNDEGIETTHPIEVVNWTNEEGSRFQPAMQGSGVWAGAHDLETEYEKTDTDGVTLREELERIGYRGDVPAEPQETYESYLELHVEQGPKLEAAGSDVGVVTGIVGFTWGKLTFVGNPDHSGPTPMDHRSDALVAAADTIQAVRRIGNSLGAETVGTVGSIDVSPNSVNIIPGKVTMTWGFRDSDDAVVQRAYEMVLAEANDAASREGVELESEETMRAESVDFADRCIEAVQSAADDLEYDSLQLGSGAGHDATHLASVTDTGMVFAVSEDGKSHSPAEYTSWEDCYAAANTLANAALTLAHE
ncbi:N-carbamoyl-L-amino-acid hydrolase [Natronorubrum sediminis]|uniref:N-carbamoyl-L-amino-acid hydrolase n=1 Tax=Natronorubrum sediminis TaxID=640943 RepID=A0A1H6FPF8_9EURY|nr:Zn-dependent hydrolase [Natronorubrum sediminis]SEH12787.1 N-carbamoyl-L-amino-acid hydrolase [Natronorubrum sediminis]